MIKYFCFFFYESQKEGWDRERGGQEQSIHSETFHNKHQVFRKI